jgi:site-specific recombinase XerD
MMLEELQRRNFSQTTVRTYLKVVEHFARHFHRRPDQLGSEHIRSYQVYLLQVRKLGVRTVRRHTAALRFFFCKTMKRSYPVEEVPYPRAPRRLPVILGREGAIWLIESAGNLFHRAMLITMYSTGRRLPRPPQPAWRDKLRTEKSPQTWPLLLRPVIVRRWRCRWAPVWSCAWRRLAA